MISLTSSDGSQYNGLEGPRSGPIILIIALGIATCVPAKETENKRYISHLTFLKMLYLI